MRKGKTFKLTHMNNHFTTYFLAQNSDKFPAESLHIIKQKLDEADEQRMLLIQSQEYRTPLMVFIISLFVGQLGIDRFIIGQTGLGVAKLLTCGGLFFWYLVDLFIIMDATKESNLEKFMRVA